MFDTVAFVGGAGTTNHECQDCEQLIRCSNGEYFSVGSKRSCFAKYTWLAQARAAFIFWAQVEWKYPADPTKGYRFLYLSDADYSSIAQRADTAVLKAEPFFADNGAASCPSLP